METRIRNAVTVLVALLVACGGREPSAGGAGDDASPGRSVDAPAAPETAEEPEAPALPPPVDPAVFATWMPDTFGGRPVQDIATWVVDGPYPPRHVAARALLGLPWKLTIKVFADDADARGETPPTEEAVRAQLAKKRPDDAAGAVFVQGTWAGAEVACITAGEGDRGAGIVYAVRGPISIDLRGPADAEALKTAFESLDWDALTAE